MGKVVDYYFTPVSPWTYLGHARFIDIAHRHGAAIAVKPVDLGKVFSVSGGLPLKQRSAQRQAYRLMELERWRHHLGVPLNVQPRHFPVSGDLASKWILAAVWAEERDVSDAGTLAALAAAQGIDAVALATRAGSDDLKARYEALTQEAIDRQVFGAPTYIYRDEAFWGQDRLDFLDRALAK
jgi:2-hydroxychromene-2-carboxylate isomerase